MADISFTTAGAAMAAVVSGLSGQAVSVEQQNAATAGAIAQFAAAEPFSDDPSLDLTAPAEVMGQMRLPFEKA
jgi:hypothetical protein